MLEARIVETVGFVGSGRSPTDHATRTAPVIVRDGQTELSAAEASGLIGRIAVARDRQAFAVLFAYYFPRVKAYLLRVGASPGLAEEMAQETMLRVWRKAESFNPAVATVSTWIYVIARNLRTDGLRSERPYPEADPSEEPEQPATGETIVISHERNEKLRQALDALSADQSRIIKLFYFEELPHSEIAKLLGTPLGTVKSRIRLAVQRLRAELEVLES